MDIKKVIVCKDRIVLDATGNAVEKYSDGCLRVIDLDKDFPYEFETFEISVIFEVVGVEVRGKKKE